MFLNEDHLSDDSSFEDYISVSPPSTMELNHQAQSIAMPQVIPEVSSHGNVQTDCQPLTGQLVDFRPASLGNANPEAIPFENAMLSEVSSQGWVLDYLRLTPC